MTRRLFILRHAKAGWDDPSLSDFDRPLTGRGLAEAAELAALCVARDYAPASIACSTALRTRQTLAGLLSGLPGDTAVQLTRALYNASADTLLQHIRTAPADCDSLMLIAHNPGVEDLARALAGTGPADARLSLSTKYPPAGLAVIDVDGDWKDVAPGDGTLAAWHLPR